MNPLLLLDYAGVAVFAATGALSASRKQMDVVGFLFLGAVTGIGGGTFRDLILGVPVFWVLNPAYVLVCACVAILVYFGAHRLESRYVMLLWLDAVGLAAYAVLGAAKGMAVTDSATVAIVMGMLTATFGGILRDLLAGEPSVLLRPEIYVTAAIAGAALFTGADLAGLPLVASAPLAFAGAFAVRGGALLFGWRIPTYRSRPGRRPEDIPRRGAAQE
ncbi:MAG: trimeric intracellular cation channel family protein [Rhizobiaceae bacterium]|nr:trimeric intracellular cation channel family protein [Rhizobiaceae bacterium]